MRKKDPLFSRPAEYEKNGNQLKPGRADGSIELGAPRANVREKEEPSEIRHTKRDQASRERRKPGESGEKRVKKETTIIAMRKF